MQLTKLSGKIKPDIKKIMADYQNGFRGGRSIIYSVFVLKIINEKILGV
jgi:hypothetical protein